MSESFGLTNDIMVFIAMILFAIILLFVFIGIIISFFRMRKIKQNIETLSIKIDSIGSMSNHGASPTININNNIHGDEKIVKTSKEDDLDDYSNIYKEKKKNNSTKLNDNSLNDYSDNSNSNQLELEDSKSSKNTSKIDNLDAIKTCEKESEIFTDEGLKITNKEVKKEETESDIEENTHTSKNMAFVDISEGDLSISEDEKYIKQTTHLNDEVANDDIDVLDIVNALKENEPISSFNFTKEPGRAHSGKIYSKEEIENIIKD